MSAATVPTANGSVTSVVEYVRGLPPEEKGHVLIALLRELIEVNGGGKGLIPIHTLEGESLGYYVPPLVADAEAEAVLPKLSPERRAELDRRLLNPGPTLTAQETIAALKAQAVGSQTQSQSSSGSR